MSISRDDLPRFLALGAIALLVVLALLLVPNWGGDDGLNVTADDSASDSVNAEGVDAAVGVIDATATPLATITPLPTPTPIPTMVPPTETPIPPTATEVPATATPVPATATAVPATATTEVATATPEPATATPEPATATPVPATATPTPIPPTATPEVVTATSTPVPEDATVTATPLSNALGVGVFAGPTYAVGAQNLYVRADGGLNVRPAPGDKSRVVAVLEDGASIAISGRAVNDEDGIQWFELSAPSTLANAWIDARFVSANLPPTPTPSPTPVPGVATAIPTSTPTGVVNLPTPDQWLAVRLCESGNDYTINTGNGYFGAYQFSPVTWDSIATRFHPHLVGVSPNLATPADQDAMALSLYQTAGRGQWPRCGLNLPQ